MVVNPGDSIQVLFSTKTEYPLPEQRFMLPVNWKRYHLSQLINTALGLSQPIPFDFLVHSQILRGSLEDWCNENDIGTESILEIEYIFSLLPPSRLSVVPHPDWVSGVSYTNLKGQDTFVTSSYDGQVRFFDAARSSLHSFRAHNAPITGLCILTSNGSQESISEDEETIIATSSHDNTARLTAYNSSAHSSRPVASLHLHTAPISMISSSSSTSSPKSLLLTAGWDSLIGLWDIKIPSSHEVPTPQSLENEGASRKRRKVHQENEEREVKRKAPISVLKSHKARVTSVVFANGEGDEKNVHRAYSCSLDSTIRSWDVESGVCLNTASFSEKPFLSLVTLNSPSLLVASSTDRTMSVLDTRSSSSSNQISSDTISNSSLRASLSQQGTPSVLAPSPVNSSHFASGGYDGIVRVWDIRSTKEAIASFRAGESSNEDKTNGKGGDSKVLALSWDRGVLAVGGEGGLDLWRVPEGTTTSR